MSVNAASAIFYPSDPYENYPDKENMYKESLKPIRQCTNCQNEDRA